MPDNPTPKDPKTLVYGEVIGGWRFRDRRWGDLEKEILVFAKVFDGRKYDRAFSFEDEPYRGKTLEEALAILDEEVGRAREEAAARRAELAAQEAGGGGSPATG